MTEMQADIIQETIEQQIVHDMQNGSLWLADDETLEMMVRHVYENIGVWRLMGAIIGEG
tara:strand:+ start:1076 stop:1252 length:177 start_codon:yes stop_codon:yes gene_type:complete